MEHTDLQAGRRLDPLFLRTCRREPVEAVPVWLLGQAGMYLPEHRRLREGKTLKEIVTTPDLAVEASLQPIRRFGFDACVLFTEPLLPAASLGVDVVWEPGLRVDSPVRSEKAVQKLRRPDIGEDLGFVLESLRSLRRELPPTVALVGLSAGPFTLAGLLVEGAIVPDCSRFKSLMFGDPVFFHALMEKASLVVGDFLLRQIQEGAQAVLIVDPLAGSLTLSDYREYVLPHLRRVMDTVQVAGVPRMLHGTAASDLLELQVETGADVLSLDWRVDVAGARERWGEHCVLQGNLDPDALFAPPQKLEDRVGDIIKAGGPSHIFNLGHELPAAAPLEAVENLVSFVHRAGKHLPLVSEDSGETAT